MLNLLLLIGLFYLMYRLSSGLGILNNTANQDPNKVVVTPYDVELNLLTLASLIIRADGVVNVVEQDYVRNYFVKKYGKEYANAAFRTFNQVLKNREIQSHRVCYYLLHKTNYEERLEILQFLFGVAASDGYVSNYELFKLEEIAGFLKIYRNDYETIRMMFYIKQQQRKPVPPNAYRVLNVPQTASNAEVKKAYRDLVKKYHPDKVITNSEVEKQDAEKNFREVQAAYEQIQKERGI